MHFASVINDSASAVTPFPASSEISLELVVVELLLLLLLVLLLGERVTALIVVVVVVIVVGLSVC
jgi:hypothetical protein